MRELFEVVFVNLKVILRILISEFFKTLKKWFGRNGR